MATVAARNRGKAQAQSQWKTIRIPPDSERERLIDEGMRCLGEKKINHDEFVVLYGCLSRGLITGTLADPDSDSGIDIHETLNMETEELCDRLHSYLNFPRQKLMKNLDMFVELGFLQGLEPREDA